MRLPRLIFQYEQFNSVSVCFVKYFQSILKDTDFQLSRTNGSRVILKWLTTTKRQTRKKTISDLVITRFLLY